MSTTGQFTKAIVTEDIGYIHAHPEQVNTRNGQGKSPIFVALANRRNKAARELLEMHADLSLTTHTGWTIFHLLAQQGDVHTLKYILENYPNEVPPNWIEMPTDAGDTPIMLAAYEGQAQMLDLLIQHEAMPNKANKHNLTVVDYLLRRDDVACLRVLNKYWDLVSWGHPCTQQSFYELAGNYQAKNILQEFNSLLMLAYLAAIEHKIDLNEIGFNNLPNPRTVMSFFAAKANAAKNKATEGTITEEPDDYYAIGSRSSTPSRSTTPRRPLSYPALQPETQ